MQDAALSGVQCCRLIWHAGWPEAVLPHVLAFFQVVELEKSIIRPVEPLKRAVTSVEAGV
jgi:hypothetical protein